MLSKKYIKYNPEITYEVFQKIWNKLIDSGWKCSDSNIKGCYREFSGVYSYLINNPSEPSKKEFITYDSITDNFTKGHTEISYKDFLDSNIEDEIIIQAKENYPPGTQFKALQTPDGTISNSIHTTGENYTWHSDGKIVCNKGNLYIKGKWAPIVNSDLLAKAYLKYPEGTVCSSAFSSAKFIIKSNDVFNTNGAGDIFNKDGYIIYDKGQNKWSEIINDILKLKLKIGDKVRVIKEKPNSGNTAVVGYVGILTHIDTSNVPYAVNNSWCIDVELVETSLEVPKEWYKLLKEGDYVVSLTTVGNMRTKDFVYKIQDTNGTTAIRYIRNDGSQGGTSDFYEFRKATPEEETLYKKAGKACSIYAAEKNLPTDKELLDYANKHFIIGTKFISSIVPNDNNAERTCTYHQEYNSFDWKIISVKGVRTVYCSKGIKDGKGCSNPYIYNDNHGWVKITYNNSFQPIKTSEEIAVKITTQEEWNIVMYTVRSRDGYYNSFSSYSNSNPGTININDGRHSPVSYYEREGYTLITFSEWCSKNHINPDVSKHPIGRYVVFLKDYGTSKKGDIDNVIALKNHNVVLKKEGICSVDSTYIKGFFEYSEAVIFSTSLLSKVESVLGDPIDLKSPISSDALKFISSTLEMPIKRSLRSPKKQSKLKFTNN